MGSFNSKSSEKTEMKKVYPSSRRHTPLRLISSKNENSPEKAKDESNAKIPYSDAKEDDDIDKAHLMHFYYRFVWNGNFSSPTIMETLQTGASVLDVGCGPGSFLLDLASSHAKSAFVGIDQNPVFPTYIKPPNVSFYKHNILEGLPFAMETFDFVYLRFMKNYFNEEEWRSNVLPEILRVLKPGGWVEFMEIDEKIYNVGPITSNFVYTWLYKCDQNDFIDIFKYQDILQSFQRQLTIITVEVKTNAWYPISPPELRTTVDIVPELLRFAKRQVLCKMEIDDDEYEALTNKIAAEVAEHKSYSKTYRFCAQKNI
ncbi:339_t:CDS:2 [Acaulospora colombiana]|uniref:339_t:CDS:1 n=1 Tax=Acaulospora colombiana TaxID=27376 RepID=A0ACA9K5H4_9GLOM|nr:339_t:CDS:2 [Acaulospora colombiana]